MQFMTTLILELTHFYFLTSLFFSLLYKKLGYIKLGPKRDENVSQQN